MSGEKISDAREALYEKIRHDLAHVMVRYGGTEEHSDHPRAEEAWREAKLSDLLDEVMVFLKAGLDPWLFRQAHEDGLAAARRVLDREREALFPLAASPLSEEKGD